MSSEKHFQLSATLVQLASAVFTHSVPLRKSYVAYPAAALSVAAAAVAFSVAVAVLGMCIWEQTNKQASAGKFVCLLACSPPFWCRLRCSKHFRLHLPAGCAPLRCSSRFRSNGKPPRSCCHTQQVAPRPDTVAVVVAVVVKSKCF